MPSSSSSRAQWLPPSLAEFQQQLAGYDITALLGVGGMGAVYEGRQKNLDRQVAIKLLPSALHRSEDGSSLNYAERFRQEAQAMAKLDHPAIVSVYDFGQTADDDFYFVMEFIDGMDIHQYLHSRGGKLPGRDALAIIAHVLDGLGYAHENGIVHRDIKPANILISSKGRVKIADFGLAKSFAEDEQAPQLTMTNMAIGTPDYVAPEVTQQGTRPDHRADLYAIGVMLYQLLTGDVPRGRWRPPHEVVPELDPRFGPIIEKALETDPDERYDSAATFRADLDQILTAPKPAETGTAPVKVVKLVTGPVKGKVKGAGTSAARTADAAEPPVAVAVAVAEPDDDGAAAKKKKKRLVLGAAVGLPVIAVIAVLLVISQKKDPESAGGSATESPSPTADSQSESASAKAGSGASAEGPYAEIGRRLEQALEEEEREEKRRAAEGKDRKDETKTASASPSDSDSKPAGPAAVDYPVPSPAEYTAEAIAAAGPPLVGRWRPLVGESDVSRDGSEPGEGDSFLLGCKKAGVKLDTPTPILLIRWRGFRGNSMSFEYKGSNGASGRKSFHIGSGGGAHAHLGPPSDSGAARRFDHHYYCLFEGNKKYLWEVFEGQDPGVKVGAGQQSAATNVKNLTVTTWNPHGLPYFKPALFRRCDTMIPTGEQLAELQAARTTADFRALSWTAFPPDAEYEGFLDAVDAVCEKFAAHDFEGARDEAAELLEKHVLLKQNPHGEILNSIRDAAGAVVALGKATEAGKSPPELKDNSRYRFDADSGHAFVMAPLFLVRDEAEAFARACGGHLATVSDGESSQSDLLREWLTPLVPLGVFSGTSGRRIQAYHCGASNLDASGLRWTTGEPSAKEGANDAETFPSGYGYLVQEWKARKQNGADKKTMLLSWSLIDDSTFAFPLVEFPAAATRYPNVQFNHPAARDAAPGTTGDPLLDFENRFTQQWREAVEQPNASLEGKLRQKYSEALEQRARAIAQAGDLDAVLPWHFEIETIRSGRPPGLLGSETPEDLRRLRGIWDSEWQKIEAQREELMAQAIAAADSELAEIEKQLVQQKQLDRAAAVQKRRKQIAAREALPGAIGS